MMILHVQSWLIASSSFHRGAVLSSKLAAQRQQPDDDAAQQEDDLIKVIPQASYGVSFMGGDPCGSKYNDDPFDATKERKPGIPDDVKARIAALAEQKKREMEERKRQEEESM